MATLPWKCEACGRSNYHYSTCRCPDGRLKAIDAEREAIKARLVRLDAMEREVLGLVSEDEMTLDLHRARR